jgi:hypothetical protein
MGPPSIPPTTIPSYVPTPNISVPLISQPPAGPLGASDLPQPGASLESFNPLGFSPSGQTAADLTQMPYRSESPAMRLSQPPEAERRREGPRTYLPTCRISSPKFPRRVRVHGKFVNHAAIGIWNRPRQWYRQA